MAGETSFREAWPVKPYLSSFVNHRTVKIMASEPLLVGFKSQLCYFSAAAFPFSVPQFAICKASIETQYTQKACCED